MAAAALSLHSCAADGLIEIGEEVTSVAPGDAVAFIPFDGFGRY